MRYNKYLKRHCVYCLELGCRHRLCCFCRNKFNQAYIPLKKQQIVHELQLRYCSACSNKLTSHCPVELPIIII